MSSSAKAISDYISANQGLMGGGGGAMGMGYGGGPVDAASMRGRPPTEKQLLYAITLAQQRNVGLSAAELLDRSEISRFIDESLAALRGGGGGPSGVSGGVAAAAGAAAVVASSAGGGGMIDGGEKPPPSAPEIVPPPSPPSSADEGEVEDGMFTLDDADADDAADLVNEGDIPF